MLVVTPTLTIPDEDLRFSFSRSSGPWWQNVNKVNSKATLHFSVRHSASLSPGMRERFAQKFGSRLTNDGDVVITSQESRDQPKNVDSCLEKLRQMLLEVLHPPKKRRATKPSKGSQRRRVEAKKRRSQVKEGRRGGFKDE
ncbi:MAG: aminoacyl-tRNA hydrolase [Planctomycetales bacterium]|nr:aminoacyl-tRNA hydrolase [Planctomycetales bacterium]